MSATRNGSPGWHPPCHRHRARGDVRPGRRDAPVGQVPGQVAGRATAYVPYLAAPGERRREAVKQVAVERLAGEFPGERGRVVLGRHVVGVRDVRPGCVHSWAAAAKKVNRTRP